MAQNSPGERRTAGRARTGADDHVTINNIQYQLRNWSAVGLLFGPMANPPALGEKLTMKVAVMLKKDRLRFNAVGEVLRVQNGEVAVRYECQSPEAFPQIRGYFESMK